MDRHHLPGKQARAQRARSSASRPVLVPLPRHALQLVDPFAVLFAITLGMFRALGAMYLRDYPYDIYTQIGIVT
jgi:hypothetical protein